MYKFVLCQSSPLVDTSNQSIMCTNTMSMATTINDLPYDCLDRVLAIADETQELKREVARLRARGKFLMKRNAGLKTNETILFERNLILKAKNRALEAREKHLMECNASMEASVVMERNIILKARETHLLECNAGLKTNETILFECNTSLKARETSLMECNARLRYRLEAATTVLEKLTKMTPPCAAPRPRRSARLAMNH